jgi:hypothetical protein
VVCDASDEDIAAIIYHLWCKPIYFASRVITKTEKGYPFLHREVLAIVFGLEKFYKYSFGYDIKVYTDHKPLLGILNKKNCLKLGVVASTP